MTPQNAVILVRFSDPRLGDTHSIDAQARRCRALADSLDWQVGPDETHIVGGDTSAYKRKKIDLPNGRRELRTVRPGFRRVLDMLASGQADALVADDLDRAARDPRDLEDLIDVIESRRPPIPVASVSGSLRLANDGDVTMGRVLVAVANKSSRDTARRVSAQRLDTAKAGGWGGGRRPYGYKIPLPEPDKNGKLIRGRLVIDDGEAEEVRSMASALLSGVSLRQIAMDLRDRGVPTVTGSEWTAGVVRDILTKPAVAGLSVYKGQVIGKASWPPVLDESTWTAIRSLVHDPARRAGKTTSNAPRWLGSMLFKCYCGQVVRTHWSGGTRRAYMCPTGHLSKGAEPVDQFVTETIIARLSKPDAINLIHREPQPDKVKLNDELAVLRELEKQLGIEYAAGRITGPILRSGSEDITRQIRAIESQVAKAAIKSPVDAVPVGSEKVAEVFTSLPLHHKREIIRALCTVVLTRSRPGIKYVDPATIDIVWTRPEDAE